MYLGASDGGLPPDELVEDADTVLAETERLARELHEPGPLGRMDIGSLEAAKCADLAIWRTDVLELGGATDSVAGLILSAPHRVDTLLVGGVEVVRDGELTRADEREIAATHRAQARRLAS